VHGFRLVGGKAEHADQNIYLQAVSLNPGTAVTEAFQDGEVKKILEMLGE